MAIARLPLESVEALVVDPNDFVRKTHCQMLRSLGVGRVFEAKDGKEALRLYMLRPTIDVIMSEVVMEGLDGLHMIKLLRKSKESPNRAVPVILVTAHASHSTVTKARDYGANEVMVKPVSPEILRKRLNSVIGNHRAFIYERKYVGPDRRRREERGYDIASNRRTAPQKFAFA